ncbi:MAG: type-F conjugative transfer system secretin TraK [Candidatus Nitricoxidivorans perseverans]|uniref:Type-F conjugative transfer system secretin TraK n=1 Tax=Candidatus Nitricoxidivorans perseverans TaxID=2975601 RepID=A0AA49FL37_9PROT|nr:MAG: type-F conjugative transfer system secretin TraK [Candidatus Nitricoxidivorans perseverans]
MNKILLIPLLVASFSASAAQVLVGKPDDTLSARVSRAEPTLIRIDGHRVRRIFGAEGEFAVTADKEAGTAYIKPSTDKSTLSLFVSDESGRTWKLLLSVIDGPSDSITIKSRSISGAVPGQGRDVPRNQLIKRVLLSLQSEGDGEFDFRVSNEIVPLWSEALFVLTKVIDGPLKGEKYQLTNTSANLMVLDERELYRRHVVAVSIAKPQLSPGESTDVFVLSESTDE